MIFASAALVVIAVVALFIGFVTGSPGFISGSIGVSALAALVLVAGAYLRRTELFAGAVPPKRTLEQELSQLAQRLSRDARRLVEIEADIQGRAALARQLQVEVEENDRRAEQSREQADAQRKNAEAVEELLKARTDVMAEFFEKRSRKAQLWYLLIGGVLGGVIGVALQELMDLVQG